LVNGKKDCIYLLTDVKVFGQGFVVAMKTVFFTSAQVYISNKTESSLHQGFISFL
jgi:hypothetical protein